jgi:hypothetical protein
MKKIKLGASSGKVLPFIFTRGYLYSFEGLVGRPNFISYFEASAQVLVPDKDIREKWLRPLRDYLVYEMTDYEPLDYIYLALFQEGLKLAYANEPYRDAFVANRTSDIGQQWWFGVPPVFSAQERTSLHYLLAPYVLQRLDMFKLGHEGVGSDSLKTFEELARLGIQIFVDELHNQSNITCSVQRFNNDSTVIIEDCPFCFEQSSLCRVFYGVIEGLLIWLYGKNQPNEIVPKIQINESKSSGHYIVIDRN